MTIQRKGFHVAAHLLLFRQGQVLLLRRHLTGWEDGKYSVIAGHLDGNESVIAAMIREAKEEADLELSAEQLDFAHVMHRRKPDGEERIDFFLSCRDIESEPTNAEPHKCDDLRWFSTSCLPLNMVEYVRAALRHIEAGNAFSVHGFGQ